MKKDRVIDLPFEAFIKGDTYIEKFRPILQDSGEFVDPDTFNVIKMDIRIGPEESSGLLITAKMEKLIGPDWVKTYMDIQDGVVIIKIPADITENWNTGLYYRDIRFVKGVFGVEGNYPEILTRGFGQVGVYNNITEIQPNA